MSVLTIGRGEPSVNRHELQERYEIRGDETDYLAAKPRYEQALAGGGDP